MKVDIILKNTVPRIVKSNIIAHRGASFYAPENTLAAIRKAKEMKATWVEIDVALTKDRHLVIMHDDTVDRTTNGQGAVFGRTLTELKNLDAGSWFSADFKDEPIPTLDELVDLVLELNLSLQLEIKPSFGNDKELAELTVERFETIWPKEKLSDVFITSFSEVSIDIAAKSLPHIPRAIAFKTIPEHPHEALKQANAQIIHLLDNDYPLKDFERFAQSGVEFAVAIVNDPKRARALLDIGCQTLITDKPDLLS